MPLPYKWSCLVELSEWGLGLPEIWHLIKKSNALSEQNNHFFEAVVVKTLFKKHILINSHAAFKNVPSEFFDNHDEALSWLSNIQKVA